MCSLGNTFLISKGIRILQRTEFEFFSNHQPSFFLRISLITMFAIRDQMTARSRYLSHFNIRYIIYTHSRGTRSKLIIKTKIFTRQIYLSSTYLTLRNTIYNLKGAGEKEMLNYLHKYDGSYINPVNVEYRKL